MKFTVNYSETNYGFAVIEAESKEEAEDRAMEVYSAGNVIWVSSEISDICAERDSDPITEITPVTNPDYWDCQCDGKYIQSKTVEECEKCGAWSGEMPDSRQAEIDEGIFIAESKQGPTATAFRYQEYDYASFKKTMKSRRRKFITLNHDRITGKYTARDVKGVIIGDIGLDWRRSRFGMRWFPTHIPTKICFPGYACHDPYEAYVLMLNRINSFSENPQAACDFLEKTGA